MRKSGIAAGTEYFPSCGVGACVLWLTAQDEIAGKSITGRHSSPDGRISARSAEALTRTVLASDASVLGQASLGQPTLSKSQKFLKNTGSILTSWIDKFAAAAHSL